MEHPERLFGVPGIKSDQSLAEFHTDRSRTILKRELGVSRGQREVGLMPLKGKAPAIRYGEPGIGGRKPRVLAQRPLVFLNRDVESLVVRQTHLLLRAEKKLIGSG